MRKDELKKFLDQKVNEYNNSEFIETDPVSIPHGFTKKEDIEIAGFLSATIAWGNRKSILKNASNLMDLLWNSPHDFILNHTDNDLLKLENFVHRTFNGADLQYFVISLKNIYNHHSGLENVFSRYAEPDNLQLSIHHFKKIFFELQHLPRTEKHVSDPLRNSAAKRINISFRVNRMVG